MLPNSKYCPRCGNKHLGQDCAVDLTRIEWQYEGADIKLYGSWSQFQVGYQLIRSRQPPFFPNTEQNLPPGTYQYIFVVDGEWRHDPNKPFVKNSYGSLNNIIQVVPKKQNLIDSSDEHSEEEEDSLQPRRDMCGITIKTYIDCSEVYVRGSWDNWVESIQLTRKFLQVARKYLNYTKLYLQPGSYQYKFIIGNQWIYDQTLPTIDNEFNSKNNIIHVMPRRNRNSPCNFSRVYFTQYQLTHKFERIQGLTMTSIGEDLYIFGGRGMASDYKNEIYIVNPRTKSISLINEERGQVPEPRAFHNAIKYGNKIIYFGGLNQDKVFNDYYVFNTTNKTWNTCKPTGQVPPPKEKASLSLLPNFQILIQFGGYFCTHDSEAQKYYNDIYCLDLVTMVWSLFEIDSNAPRPPPRSAHSATVIKNRLYIFGGQSMSEGHFTYNFNDLWMIDFSAYSQWIDLTKKTRGKAPSPRHGHCAVNIAHQIFVFGGRGESANDLMNDLYHLNPFTLVWSQPDIQGKVPIPRYYFASEVLNNSELWIVGGHKGSQYSTQIHHAHVYVMSFEEQSEEETQMPGSPIFAAHTGPPFTFDINELIKIVPSKTG